VYADASVVGTGDGKFIFAIPQDMDGFVLSQVEAYVTTASSAGIVQAQLRNVTEAADMLSTRVQVDANELASKDSATQPVIDAANAAVTWADQISVDVDASGTGARGLGVILTFE
jgi:hypothetical protein